MCLLYVCISGFSPTSKCFFYQRGKRKKTWAMYHSGSVTCSTYRLISVYICHCPWWVFHSPAISSILRSPLHLRLPLHLFWLFFRDSNPDTIPGFRSSLRCPQSYSLCDLKAITMRIAIIYCQGLLPVWDVHPLEHSFFMLTLRKRFCLYQINYRFHHSGASV